MPTVLTIGPHRFYFFSKEGQEPPHIHVETAENAAKFWLSPVSLVWTVGYNFERNTATQTTGRRKSSLLSGEVV